MTIYGIPNCDTVQKTIKWFNAHKIAFEFYDHRQQGLTKAKLKQWVKQVGHEVLLNKKSTSWRALSKEGQAAINSSAAAIQLMHEMPTIIKRPVIENEDTIIAVGFDEQTLAQKIKDL